MPPHDAKTERLKGQGILNPHPERVRAPAFQVGGFFDARDLVQVKYEMVRQVHQAQATKAGAAAQFGLSRPTFYQAEAALARAGLAGLLPQPRGPKGAHKLTPEVMVVHRRAPGGGRPAAGAPPGAPDRSAVGRVGASAHDRTGGRAPKKTVATGTLTRLPPAALATYETLRAAVLSGQAHPEGLGALRFHGLLQGLRVLLAEPAVVPPTPAVNAADPRRLPHDPVFVHQLVNLLLHTQSEVRHVD